MEPVAELDERFSDEGASATQWAEVLGVLESAETFWVTTVRADGRPHVTPLVAVWLDDALAFCTGANEQKAVNLRGNQHVILSTGCNDWDKGIDVIVEGIARAGDRRRQAAATCGGVDEEVGRTMAVPGRRRWLPAGRRRGRGPGVRGRARQGPQLRQGALRSHPLPIPRLVRARTVGSVASDSIDDRRGGRRGTLEGSSCAGRRVRAVDTAVPGIRRLLSLADERRAPAPDLGMDPRRPQCRGARRGAGRRRRQRDRGAAGARASAGVGAAAPRRDRRLPRRPVRRSSGQGHRRGRRAVRTRSIGSRSNATGQSCAGRPPTTTTAPVPCTTNSPPAPRGSRTT